MDQEKVPQEDNYSSVHEVLPERIDIPIEALANRTKSGGVELDKLAFELYKETAGVVVVCASAIVSYEEPSEFSYDRNQAICVGLLVRIVKFMRAILAILSYGDNLGEVMLALLRCIGESAINVRYLILKNDESLFDQYVKTSLGPEREMYDVIRENVKERQGEILPVETRMFASIDRLCKISGVQIEEVSRKHTEWGGSMRDRLKALGLEHTYAVVQRIPSHAVHGTWVDLVLHHLEPKPSGFLPSFEDSPVDTRILSPICIFVLAAVDDYHEKFLRASPEAEPLKARIDDLIDRLQLVSTSHEEWYQQNKTIKVEPSTSES